MTICNDYFDLNSASSELGTKSYWDEVYNHELKNFKDHGDVGEIWFGEESITRVLQWIQTYYSGNRNDPVLDIGCGNGMTLIQLTREGFTNLLGLDYSPEAIELASSIAEQQAVTDYVSFRVSDILANDLEESNFTLVLDKGTYDAITLDSEHLSEKRKVYTEKVNKLLRPEGLFIITSCNWTDNELNEHFKKHFRLKCVIPTPEFIFAGKIGKLISCVVFEKR